MIVQLLTNHPNAIAVYCEAKTSVILLQNGVYAASKLLFDYPSLSVYALRSDWQASGLAEHPSISLISAPKWVELCALHHPVVTIQHAN